MEPKKIKSVTVFIIFPPICHEVMGPDAMILVFCMLSFKPAFSLSSFTYIKKLFIFSSLSAIRVVSSAYLREPNKKGLESFPVGVRGGTGSWFRRSYLCSFPQTFAIASLPFIIIE